MKLAPLQQWFCDRCGGVIEQPKDGWLHWRKDDEGRVHSIEILHHKLASPRGGEDGCYPGDMELDMHLDQMIGNRGLIDLLSLMDPGAFHDPKGRDIGKVKDIRNWVEVIRRLHLPYYEQARHYFERARHDELEDINEIALYKEAMLRELVDRYADEE